MEEAALVFLESGRWPEVHTLQARSGRCGERLQHVEAAALLPSRLGHVVDGRVVLTIEGLASISAAHAVVVDYLRVLELAVRRYEAQRDQHLSRRDLGRHGLGLHRERVRQIWCLLDADPEVFDRRGRQIWHRVMLRVPVTEDAWRFSKAPKLDLDAYLEGRERPRADSRADPTRPRRFSKRKKAIAAVLMPIVIAAGGRWLADVPGDIVDRFRPAPGQHGNLHRSH